MRFEIEEFLEHVETQTNQALLTKQTIQTNLDNLTNNEYSLQDRQRGRLALTLLDHRLQHLDNLKTELEELQILYSDNLQQLSQPTRLRVQVRDYQRLLRLCINEL